jgi:hypothetical protein
VLVEGRTQIGHREIISWRREAAASYRYSATVTEEERLGRAAQKIVKHLDLFLGRCRDRPIARGEVRPGRTATLHTHVQGFSV